MTSRVGEGELGIEFSGDGAWLVNAVVVCVGDV